MVVKLTGPGLFHTYNETADHEKMATCLFEVDFSVEGLGKVMCVAFSTASGPKLVPCEGLRLLEGIERRVLPARKGVCFLHHEP